MIRLAFICDRLDSFIRADIAGIDTNLIDTCIGYRKRDAIVKMDIGDERDLHVALFELHNGVASVKVGNRQAHDLTACFFKLLNLFIRRIKIMRIGIGHRLDGDGSIAADLYVANTKDAGFSSFKCIAHYDPSFSFIEIT